MRDQEGKATPEATTTRRQNEALRAFVERLGVLLAETLELDPLAQLVATSLTEAVGGTGCDLYVYRGGRLCCLASLEQGEFCADYVGMDLDLERFPATAAVIAGREILVVEDADDARLTELERAEFAEFGRRSELCLPLLIDEQVVGLLDIFSDRPRGFVDCLDLARSVGQLVAGAIANALLLEELEHSNRDLRTLVECGRDFAATLNPEDVLLSVAQTMKEASGATCCDLFELDGDDGIRGLVSVDEGGVDEEFPGTCYPMEECLAVRIPLDSQERYSVPDAQSDPRLSSQERDDLVTWGYRAVLVLPLRTRQQTLGVAMLYDRRVREFDHVEFLEGLAQVAAQALANASLHREVVRGAERLAVVTESSMEFSSTLAIEEVLASTVARLSEVIGVTGCYIYKLVGDELVCVAAVRRDAPTQWLGTSVKLADWVSSRRAIETRGPVAIHSAEDDQIGQVERDIMHRYDERCGLVVPLIAKERVIGTVELIESRRERVFTSDEIETVRSICHVAALAIDNADLYRGLELRGRETELLNEIARRTAATLDIDEIAAAVVEELHYLVSFDRAGLVLVTDEGGYEHVYDWNGCGSLADLVAGGDPARFLRRVEDETVVFLRLPDELPEGISPEAVEGVCSIVFMGLVAEGRMIGCFVLGSDKPAAFRRVERGLLEGVATHLALALKNARMYENVRRMHLANLKALSWALNAKDYYTLGHAVRVSAYMALLGRELGWSPELRAQVEEAAYLHDIGKIGISDQVLLKPGRLNEREWELMRYHPIYGADTIGPLFDPELVRAVRAHHERYDGRGYPDGLGGDEIPEVARAMCVADSYDAMSLRRPYRRALTYTESVEELKRCRGAQFDPAMTDAFLRVLSRLEARRKKAIGAAREAARRIDVGKHGVLARPGDESRPEYGEIHEVLRDVRRRTIPDGVMMTFARREGRYVFVVDEDEQFGRAAQIGEEVFADQELPEAFAGVMPDMNALLVDQFGIWLGGRVPVMDENGEVVAVVGADLPPSDTGTGGLRSEVSTTLSQMFQSGTGRLKRTEFEAVSDGLTGLYTHRYLQERLGEELERARGAGSSVALLIADIDGFREFNERRGHAAGGRALHEIARVIENTGRRIDLPARYGGEEFGLVLLDASREGALEVAERIRERVADTRVTPHGDRLTISIGVAVFPDDAADRDGLIDKADWAMNLAKRQGRDRVATFTEAVGGEQP